MRRQRLVNMRQIELFQGNDQTPIQQHTKDHLGNQNLYWPYLFLTPLNIMKRLNVETNK